MTFANVRPFHLWLVEIGPLVGVIISLWVKMAAFNLSLRSIWAQPEELIGQWIQAYPQVFGATLASLLLLLGPLLLIRRRSRFFVLLSMDLLLTSLVVADLVHVDYYGDVISVLNLLNVPMLPWIRSSIFFLLKPIHAVFYLDILIALFVVPHYLRACRRIPEVNSSRLRIVCVGLLGFGVLLAVPTIRVVWQDNNGVFAYANLQRETCMVIGLLPYHVTDAVLSWRRDSITDAERYRVRRFLDDKRKQSYSPPELFGKARGRNLILISAESLQVFPIGLEFRGQPLMPKLSAFAKESLYFVNFYDQTYLGTTADGEFTSLQSLHPLPVGVVATNYPANQYHGLPAILSVHGYATLSAVGAPGGFWNQNQTHPRLGFQRSHFEDSYKVQERIGSWMADREFFSQTIPFLRGQTEPFMAFLLSSSNHHPWELPDKYRVLRLGELEGTLLGNYLQSVHYFDSAFGEFIDRLRESGILDKSVIALYGDHQAFLGKLPELARLLGFAGDSEYGHLLVRKKVPLIVRLPHGEGRGVRRVTGGHLDIAPTLLSLLGIVDENKVMLGEDLTRGKDSLVVFRDGSFVDGTHFFLNRFGAISNSICYELETSRTIDCTFLEEQRRKALTHMEISDLIVRNDLIPALSHGRARITEE